jgi:hypothetical protein
LASLEELGNDAKHSIYVLMGVAYQQKVDMHFLEVPLCN